MSRILAVGAHPDDVEIHCGGTLALYAKMGHKIMICHVTNGDKGHIHIPPNELSEKRKEEARKAASYIDAEIFSLDLPDGDVFYDRETRIVVINMLRQANADIILTHWSENYHPDHFATSLLVCNSTYISTLPHYKTDYEHCIKHPRVYYMDVEHDLLNESAEYVNITSVMETKRRMLLSHDSQISWLKEHDGVDLIAQVEAQDRMNGIKCGVQFAEKFVPRGFRSAERLLP